MDQRMESTPDEPDSESLKQFIGCVLEKIPDLPNSWEQLEGAVLLTINTLAKAPRISPLADVDTDNLSRFMLALCKISPKGKQIHANIALSICTKINEQPNDKINIFYSKMLLMVDIPDNTIKRQELFKLCEAARENITEKNTSKIITKFMARIRRIRKCQK